MWSKIRYLICSITKNYDEKYRKVNLNSGDDLLLNKTIEIQNVTIAARVIFHENNKHYPQVFLDKCLHKL